ncbi:PKD domain-containing protein [candidate division KSB1 bacterium]|nr:PKD domain-containing protein [candidate division KSB1 bacterium]
MTHYKKSLMKTGLILIIVLLPGLVFAQDLPGEPSGGDVTPVLIPGNPSCADVGCGGGGFKLEKAPNGTFPLTSAHGELTAGFIADPSNSIKIANSDGYFFDWSSTRPVCTVIVKAGANADVYYYYDPPSYGDTDLHAPLKPDDNQYRQISHVEFCLPGISENPGIQLKKYTNGEDADLPPGPEILEGNAVHWTYVVTNTGDVPLSGIVVTDDNGTPAYTGDDFVALPDLSGSYNVGDLNMDNLLDITEVWQFYYDGIAISGQYANIAVVKGYSPKQVMVTDDDPSHYDGDPQDPKIHLEKHTNGEDADMPTGPLVLVGDAIKWHYYVSNPGNVPLSAIMITDDNGTPADVGDDFIPVPILVSSYNVGDVNQNELLDVGETWVFAGAATAIEGQYENIAVVYGYSPKQVMVQDDDPSHYFAEIPGIKIEAEKSADAELKRTYKWTIEKSVYPDKWDLFKGDTGTSLYTISVTKSAATNVITVSGKICVTNLDPEMPTEGLKIVDELKYKTATMTDWEPVPGATNTIVPDVQIPGGETKCYEYSFTFDAIEGAEYVNVAMVTITNYYGHVGEEYAIKTSKEIGEVTMPTEEILKEINVEDTNGETFLFTETGFVTYKKTFDCDDEGLNENTATIVETKQSASALVMINCHSLEIKKDAKTSYKRHYFWTIDKWAEYEVLDLKGCVPAEVAYKVTLDTSYVDEDFKVCGTIYIHNPAPIPATINKIEDVIEGALMIELEDDALTFPYILQPEKTLEVKYCATLPDAETRKNIANVYLQNFDFEYVERELIATPSGETKFCGAVEFTFGDPEEIDECVKVTDTNFIDPLAEKLCVVDAPRTFEYVLPFGPYYSTGTITHDNTAMFVTCDTKTEGKDSWTLTIYVKCEPAIADFTAEPTSGISPLEVHFKDLSTNAARWLWDFGDGTTSEEQNPVHIYRNPPRKYYTVKLTVWDCCEEYEDSMTKENYIQVIRPTSVGFNAYPIVGKPELEVQFYNLSGGVTLQWIWTYGDGTHEEFRHSTMSMINPVHTYTEAGSYSVSLEGSGLGGHDKMCVKDLIYVDEDYAPLELVEGGKTLEGEDWNDVIDHDVIPPDASVVAMKGHAWAIFKFADLEPRMVHKIRILSNDVLGSKYLNHLAKDFQLWVSEDGVNFTPGFVSTLSFLSTWEIFEFAPIKATYLKLVLVNAKGAGSPYASICEFQVFGKPQTSHKDMFAYTMDAANQVVPLPTEYDLSQNYPNPFNPETSINYQLPEDADVRLDIYNVRGELVTTLVNSRTNAGYHRATWNAKDRFGNDVSGGLYFYSIRITTENADNYVFTKKMILLK